MGEITVAETVTRAEDFHSVGLVEAQYYTFGNSEAPFILENRQTLPEVTTCYDSYAELNSSRDKVILVEHDASLVEQMIAALANLLATP